MSSSTAENPSEVDSLNKIWKIELYRLQEDAPRPIPIKRNEGVTLPEAPDFYGFDFHGVLGHRDAEKLFSGQPEGSYLVRKSPNRGNRDSSEGIIDENQQFYTLSFKFDTKVHHFKLYYNPFLGHYVIEDSKKFENLQELVADGLLNHYLRKHGGPILDQMGREDGQGVYESSPYMTLNRRKLRALSTEMYRNCLSDEVKQATANLIKEELKRESQASVLRADDIVPPEYKKQHNFKVHNFKGLNWCDLCANFLWGFSAQGVRCDDCGFVAHEKCSKKIPPKCMPDLKKIRGVFGIDLTTLVLAYKQDIPFVVEKCVKEIEQRGLRQEGIYRVSGFADEIEQVKETLDKEGNAADMSEKSVSNINVVASILKMYLRLLPIPLITFQAYPALIEASSKYNFKLFHLFNNFSLFRQSNTC